MAEKGRGLRGSCPVMADGLDVETTAAGAKVRDAEGRVHYLNQSAAAVLLLCDGGLDGQGIAREMGALFGLSDAPIADVEKALDQLAALGLLRSTLG